MTMQAGEPTYAEASGRRARWSGGAIASGTGIAALLTFMLQNTDHVRPDWAVGPAAAVATDLLHGDGSSGPADGADVSGPSGPADDRIL